MDENTLNVIQPNVTDCLNKDVYVDSHVGGVRVTQGEGWDNPRPLMVVNNVAWPDVDVEVDLHVGEFA